jgi:hypothetical protein
MPKLRIASTQDVDSLAAAASRLKSSGARELIKKAGARRTLAKFDSLLKSLDGAARHARRCESKIRHGREDGMT